MITCYSDYFNSTWPDWINIIIIAYYFIVSALLFICWTFTRLKEKDRKNALRKEGFDTLLNEEQLSNDEEWKIYVKFDQTLWLKWIAPVGTVWFGVPLIRLVSSVIKLL